MMSKPIGFRRLSLGGGGGVELGGDRLVIRLPDPRLLLLLARALLLAAAILSLPWLRTARFRGGDLAAVGDYSAGERDGGGGGGEDFLRVLIRELGQHDLLRPRDRVVLLTDADAISRSEAMRNASVDFVFSASPGEFGLVDRILKPGGVAAVQLSTDPSESFRPPANYRTAYFGRIGSAAVAAMRKSLTGEGRRRLRRLMAVPEAKREALRGLEAVLLEPPGRRGRRQAAKYLPELTGDELDGYPRRVFVEVTAAGEASSAAAWFEENYPRKGRAFEVIRVEVEEESDEDDGGTKGQATSPSLAEWLERNVREDEYVVVKAGAAEVEEAVAEGAIGLVDELFLECDHQWWEEEDRKKQQQRRREARRRSERRAYWECLALYGKLRDAGVAVHQWWSFE